MTGRVFLDTNVAIYTIDKAGPKRERARAYYSATTPL